MWHDNKFHNVNDYEQSSRVVDWLTSQVNDLATPSQNKSPALNCRRRTGVAVPLVNRMGMGEGGYCQIDHCNAPEAAVLTLPDPVRADWCLPLLCSESTGWERGWEAVSGRFLLNHIICFWQASQTLLIDSIICPIVQCYQPLIHQSGKWLI